MAKNNKSISVIIAAAGYSSRLGENISKQFILLNNKPLLFYSLEKFMLVGNIVEIIIVTNDLQATEKVLEANNYLANKKNIEIKIVLGGTLRQDSVYNGFCKVSPDVDLVVIHDVARPLFQIEDLEKCIERASICNAAILAIPVVDTVKRAKSDNGKLVFQETINRNNLYQIQTPQVFSYRLLSDVYKSRDMLQHVSTDEASMVEQLSKESVNLVTGSRKNIKITYLEDLEIADAILKEEKEKCLK